MIEFQAPLKISVLRLFTQDPMQGMFLSISGTACAEGPIETSDKPYPETQSQVTGYFREKVFNGDSNSLTWKANESNFPLMSES